MAVKAIASCPYCRAARSYTPTRESTERTLRCFTCDKRFRVCIYCRTTDGVVPLVSLPGRPPSAAGVCMRCISEVPR